MQLATKEAASDTAPTESTGIACDQRGRFRPPIYSWHLEVESKPASGLTGGGTRSALSDSPFDLVEDNSPLERFQMGWLDQSPADKRVNR